MSRASNFGSEDPTIPGFLVKEIPWLVSAVAAGNPDIANQLLKDVTLGDRTYGFSASEETTGNGSKADGTNGGSDESETKQ